MSTHAPLRMLAALTAASFLGFLTPGPALAAPKKKPAPLPAASSWVGGQKLIESRVLTDLPAGVPAPPAPKAASWLVADLDSRTVLAGHRVHVPLAPASTLKIFTALALAPKLDPKTIYTGQVSDAAIDGTKVGIVPGSKYTVDDLLHGMLMTSGNDCANALANELGGLAPATALLQAEALRLGAFDTVVHNTSGLDAKGQVSSAYDLALAGSEALQRKQLTKIMQTTSYQFPGKGRSLSKKRKRYFIPNHDRLLYNYKGAIGVKNGYTTKARGTFVGAARRGGHTYIAVVMRGEGATWKMSAALLDWAFAHGAQARPVGTLVEPGELAAKTGPGEQVLSAASGTPSPVAEPLSGALPASGSLARSGTGLDTSFGKAGLGAAALALLGLAWVTGRRFRTRPSS